MKRNEHHIRLRNRVPGPSRAVVPGKSAPDKSWHSVLTWPTSLDEDTLESLTEALRPRRLRAG